MNERSPRADAAQIAVAQIFNLPWSLDILDWTRKSGSRRTWRQWNRSASKVARFGARMWRGCGR